MEVVAATPSGGGVPPFRDHDVREWSRIDSITGALERARIETDHWSANTINSSHKYGKVVDSRARTDAEGGLHQSARRQLEVLHSQIPGGRLHVVKTHTVATSKWTSKEGGQLGSNKGFENLQLPLNPLDLTSQKSKASVGRSVARRPPTRHHLKDPSQPSVIDFSNPSRHAHITAAANLHRVSRLCHQIHATAVKQAFGRRSPRLDISERQNGDGSVEIYEIESVSSENTTNNSHTNLVRTKSSSSDDINQIPEKDVTNNKSAEDLEDLEELQSWRRTSKIRRSLQFPKQNKATVSSKPPDLPENSGSVRKIREDLEKGRRLNTALRNNSVDLEALDQILQSISSSSTSSEKTPDDVENDSPRKQKRNSFVTVESIQEVKGRLRRTSSPTSDIYKVSDKEDDPDDGIVTEEVPPSRDKDMPLLEQSRVRSYVYGMESLLNKNPGIGTGSLESRVKLVNGNATNRNEDWYNRRKSYGFEQVHNHNNASNSISRKNKNFVESSTDSGICRSTEIVVAPSPSKRNGYVEYERCSSDELSDLDQKSNDGERRNHDGSHYGHAKKLTNTNNEEDKNSYYNKTSNEDWTNHSTDWSNSKPERKSTTIKIPIAKNNNNVVDLSWHNDADKEIKRHSIAVDESKYVTKNVNNSVDSRNRYRRTSLALNDHFSRQDDDDTNTRKTKKVEFCKTEVHFAAESGKVNIVATDEKPPPTQNFRRRRRNSGPTLEDFNKNGLPVLHFGDSSYEKTMFGITDEPDPNPIDEYLQPNLSSTFGAVTVNTTNANNKDTTDDEKKELTENEIKGILKNKPLKPRPYHLGETPVSFNESNSDDDNKWGVRLRHVDKPETPIWKSTVTVHNYNYFDKAPETGGGSEPEFQRLLKNLRPIRKNDYVSDNDNRYFDVKIDDRRSSWSVADANNKPTEDDNQAIEIKGYSTKINFGEGEATVVKNNGYAMDKMTTTWPRTDNLGNDSKQLLNKGLVVRIGREDSALNHTVCSKMTTTQDTNNTTTTTKITIDLSPSPPTKTDNCFTYAKYQGSHSHSFKSTSLILNTIKDKSEKTAEEVKNEIPRQLEALKKLYEDIQSDSDADKEVQQLMSKVGPQVLKAEDDKGSEVSGSWSKMRAYKNMSEHFGRSSVKEATARYDLKSGTKVEKDYSERLKSQENSLQSANHRDISSKYNVNVIKNNSSPIAIRKTIQLNRPELKPTEKLSSPSIVNRNKTVEPPIKDIKTSSDKKLENKHSNDGIVLRQPKKSEMTYFGVNISPKPVKKISQAVIRKENKLSEKPDLIQHYKNSPPSSRSNRTKARMKSPEADDHIYENIKNNKYGREFDSSILEELTKAADQILQAVNGYTDEDIQNRLNSDEEDEPKEQLETIMEAKSWRQEKVTAKTKQLTAKSKLKPTSSTSSVESLSRKKPTSEQKPRTASEAHPRRKMDRGEPTSAKATNTKARRLQRASSREALLQSHGSSSEDLPAKVEMPLRKPRLIKKTKATQLTITNGLEMKKSPSSSVGRRRDNVATKGEERILGSLPEIRHKTAVSTIRSTSEKATRDKARQRSEDAARKRVPVKRETTKVSNPPSRMEQAKNNTQSTHNRETVTHRISTANIKKCYRTGAENRH